MKKAAHLLIAWLAICAAGAASAQAVDCARTGSRLDAVICGDPEMRDYDQRIAAAYAQAMTIWNGAIAAYVRHDQQEWLTAFRTIETVEAAIEDDCVISDRACIRAELRRRVDDLESGAYVHSGVYRAGNGLKLLVQPGTGASYSVRVYDPARLAAANFVTLAADRSALWDGPQTMVSTMGNAHGFALPDGDGCTLRMQPRPLSIDVSQTGSCRGQRLEGSYARLLDETLRGYELELH